MSKFATRGQPQQGDDVYKCDVCGCEWESKREAIEEHMDWSENEIRESVRGTIFRVQRREPLLTDEEFERYSSDPNPCCPLFLVREFPTEIGYGTTARERNEISQDPPMRREKDQGREPEEAPGVERPLGV